MVLQIAKNSPRWNITGQLRILYDESIVGNNNNGRIPHYYRSGSCKFRTTCSSINYTLVVNECEQKNVINKSNRRTRRYKLIKDYTLQMNRATGLINEFKNLR